MDNSCARHLRGVPRLARQVVEAFTIVLAVGTVQGWRPALTVPGPASGLLAALVLVLGPVLERMPIQAFELVIGVLLLLFGLRWLRKGDLAGGGNSGLAR